VKCEPPPLLQQTTVIAAISTAAANKQKRQGILGSFSVVPAAVSINSHSLFKIGRIYCGLYI
jgi:hypothetical protein